MGNIKRSWSEIKDEHLTRDAYEIIALDPLTKDLSLSITVEGQVAHVQGTVQSEKQRQRVGELLRNHVRLYAVWDLLEIGKNKLSILDIGCGHKKQFPEALGVDQYAAPGVDIITDLEQSLPFDNHSVDHIFAANVLEHLHDLLNVMNELHRVLKPTGTLHILVPNWKNVVAVADPTHINFFAPQTFKYFCEGKPGTLSWNPLVVSSSTDTIFVDFSPLQNAASPEQIARWFY